MLMFEVFLLKNYVYERFLTDSIECDLGLLKLAREKRPEIRS